MFSTCVGTPYSFLTAVPYENALVVYAGNWAFVAALRTIGCTRPLAASWPVQSCAPMMTSGASAAATVPRSSRILPKSWTTTLTFAPRAVAHAFASCVTAVLRSWSAQMVTVGPAATADLTLPATAARIATATRARSAGVRFIFIP